MKTGIKSNLKPDFHPPFKIPDEVKEAEVKKEIKSLSNKSSKQIKEQAELKSDLNKIMTEVADNLQADVSLLSKDILIEELEGQLHKIKNENISLQASNSELVEKNIENQNKIVELKSQLESASHFETESEEVSSLRDRLASKEAEAEILKDANETAKESIGFYKDREENYKQTIEELKDQVLIAQESYEESKEDYEHSEVEASEEIFDEEESSIVEDETNSESEEQLQKISELESEIEEVKENFEVATQRLQGLEEELEDSNKDLKKFESENKELHAIRLKAKKIIKEKKSEISGLETKNKELLGSIDLLEKEVTSLKESETKLNAEVSNFQQKVEEKEAKELELVLQKEEEELTQLVGDSYEVPNDETWYFMDKDEEKGPYTFEKMLEFKNDKVLKKNTKVKQKAKSSFKTMEDFFELNTYVVTYETNQGDNRFFIKRTSFRAPFYEIVTLEIEEKEFKGYCTSLSTGGIFIEFSKLDTDLMKLNGKGVVFFKQGTLSENVSCSVQIMNISEKKPRGLGLMFVDMAEAKKDVILSYVNNFLDKSKEAA